MLETLDAVRDLVPGSLIVALIVAVWAGVRLVRAVWGPVRAVVQLVGDLKGEPARDGVEARLGVMARLAANEDTIAGLADRVDALAGEFRNNGGSTMRDRVDAIADKIDGLTARAPRRRDDPAAADYTPRA